MHCVST